MVEIYWYHWGNFYDICYLDSFKIYLLPNFWSYSCNNGNIIDIDNYGLGIIPEYCCPAPYQAELQEWLRNEHGVSVLVYLDETLSYIWTITCLHPRASIMEYHQSNEVWCGHYEDCLEAGLQAALRLM